MDSLKYVKKASVSPVKIKALPSFKKGLIGSAIRE